MRFWYSFAYLCLGCKLTWNEGSSLRNQTIAQSIESTWLHVPAIKSEITRLCHEAQNLKLFGVCIPPCWVSTAVACLGDKSSIKVVTVSGFPYGYEIISTKVNALKTAAQAGAHEIDYVMNISQYMSEGGRYLQIEAAEMVKAAKSEHVFLKGILETILLTELQRVEAARILVGEGVDMIKTSTGTIPGGGARVNDVKLLRNQVASDLKIKASGEIRTAEEAQALIQAGACRLGTSRAKDILSQT
jgi:deoxyribose-phosphate aldolase